MTRNEKGQFANGSGNQSGRPKGARNKVTLAILDLIEGEAVNLGRKAIELALNGDLTALKLCIDRIAPPQKEAPLKSHTLPELTDQKSVLAALSQVTQSLTDGELLPNEAIVLSKLLEQYYRLYEAIDLQQRIESLEATLQIRKSHEK